MLDLNTVLGAWLPPISLCNITLSGALCVLLCFLDLLWTLDCKHIVQAYCGLREWWTMNQHCHYPIQIKKNSVGLIYWRSNSEPAFPGKIVPPSRCIQSLKLQHLQYVCLIVFDYFSDTTIFLDKVHQHAASCFIKQMSLQCLWSSCS